MQVTQMMPQTVLLGDLNNLMSSIMTGEQQVSTGNAILQPSDNPVGTAEDLNITAAQAWNSQWTTNADAASGYMTTASQAMSELGQVLQSAASIASAASSATENPTDMQAQASQVGGLVQQVLALANTQFNGQYVFGGVSGTAPWNATTGSWNLTASTNPVSFEVGRGVTVQAGPDAYTLLQAAVGGGTATGILSANGASTPGILEQLQTDLQSGNQSAVASDLGAVQNAVAYVSSQVSSLGAVMDRVQAASSTLSQTSTQLAQQETAVSSTNMPSAIEQLTNLETVYQAALDVGAKMLMPTLATLLPGG